MSQAKDAGRLVGIDYLRAFFSICVVATHLGYVFPSSIFDEDRYRDHTFSWSDFVNFYVICLAVPVFMLVSTYLYALKTHDQQALLRRLGRFLLLLLFWSIAFNIYMLSFLFVKVVPHEFGELSLYFFTGGNTVYYFFLSLAIVTIATHYGMRLSTPSVWIVFAATTLLVGVLPLLHQATHFKLLGLHANPLNFLPFAYGGIIVARLVLSKNARQLKRLGIACLAMAALTAPLDWTIYVSECGFEVNKFAIPAYTRPSLIFLAMAVVIFAIRWRPRSNAVIRFMSYHSLALYCIHPFFVPLGYTMAIKMELTGVLQFVLPLVTVVGLSYLASLVAPYFLRDELIR
jgi:surface polysaccharide O-acyltransferase-like enzyme